MVDVNDDLIGPPWDCSVWGAGPIELPISLSGRVSYPHERAEYFWVLSHHETQTMFFQKNNDEFSFSKMGSRVVPMTWGNDLAAGFGNKEKWNSNFQPLWLVKPSPPLTYPPRNKGLIRPY